MLLLSQPSRLPSPVCSPNDPCRRLSASGRKRKRALALLTVPAAARRPRTQPGCQVSLNAIHLTSARVGSPSELGYRKVHPSFISGLDFTGQGRIWWGTEGSNPPSSSAESAANPTSSPSTPRRLYPGTSRQGSTASRWRRPALRRRQTGAASACFARATKSPRRKNRSRSCSHSPLRRAASLRVPGPATRR
jgi:hypothetical protein